MKRKFTDKLIAWKNTKTGRLPLLLYGARQVGKTYIIRDFGAAYYNNTVYINFERMADIHDFFAGDINPERIIRLIENYMNTKITGPDTLIIFDEIQACERALTSLKYFAEDAPLYHIIAAGSLLGVAVNRAQASFPVGKVRMETLYPMDFEEFLAAYNETLLADMIKEHFVSMSPMPDIWHNKAMEFYKNYIITGGMPAVVKYAADNKTTIGAADIQQLIAGSYVNDMAKYARASETVKIIACYESIPAQLAKDNKKFQYKIVKKGGTASHFDTSLQWLFSSGVALRCDKTQALMPPAMYADPSAFKVYMGDVGLLSFKNNLSLSDLSSEERIFSGALAENYIACHLKSAGYKLFYWESDNRAEVDFLLPKDGGIIPIEVKAGIHTKSKSLDVYKNKYSPPYCIRFSGKNFGVVNGIKSIPLYAAHLL